MFLLMDIHLFQNSWILIKGLSDCHKLTVPFWKHFMQNRKQKLYVPLETLEMWLLSVSNYSEGSNSIFFDSFSTFFQLIVTLLIYPTSIYFLCTPFNYNHLYGKYDTAFFKTRRIALQQANKMFLNNIVNTNRTTQKNNRNISLYIPKRCF